MSHLPRRRWRREVWDHHGEQRLGFYSTSYLWPWIDPPHGGATQLYVLKALPTSHLQPDLAAKPAQTPSPSNLLSLSSKLRTNGQLGWGRQGNNMYKYTVLNFWRIKPKLVGYIGFYSAAFIAHGRCFCSISLAKSASKAWLPPLCLLE